MSPAIVVLDGVRTFHPIAILGDVGVDCCGIAVGSSHGECCVKVCARVLALTDASDLVDMFSLQEIVIYDP